MRAFLPSLFTGVANSYQNMHMDSVGELVRIANGDNGTQFEQKQAEKEMESFLRILKESEETLRESLAQIELDHLVPSSAEKLVEFKDGKIIESPSLENIQKQTEQFVSNGQHSQEAIDMAKDVLSTINTIKNGQLFFHLSIENLKVITVEKKQKKMPKILALLSRIKISGKKKKT
ncbi:hypothetical protein niasHT_018952 [Heterodera trifolii]|uniref:Uncharacterized protein n=1 Tax=Heterodera trifolii TaxID=157864 RepID=A0ABD2LEM4_9BILA